MMEILRHRFAALPARQQLWLLAAAIGLLLLLLIESCWVPLAHAAARLKTSNATTATALTWMQQSAAEVRTLQGAGVASAGAVTGSLTQRINTTAQAAGVLVNRLQPTGPNEARVWVENLAWDAAMHWLHALETDANVQVRSLALNETSSSGHISLQALLVTPASH